MSLKQEIETWVQALALYDNHEYEEALKVFDNISDTSKILFNCGVIHATLGEHDKAVECYQRAIKRDNYLAVAYFQQGVSNFLIGDFEEALANFNDTLLFLRGNRWINYEQLGLNFKLYSCEVLFNRGLCYIYLQQKLAGLGDLKYAAQETEDPVRHEVIDEAIREEAEGYTVFCIPAGTVYRPNSAKVKNLPSKDYLGKARLVATADQTAAYTGSASSEAKAFKAGHNRGMDDRPPDSISYAASNLVKVGLRSRSRQQSEPPGNRNVFPPTPPPDHDPVRPTFTQASTSPPTNPPTLANPASSPPKPSRPEPLNLDSITQDPNKPRIGTTRTASEPRGPSNAYRNYSSRDQTGPPPRRLFRETTGLRPHSNGAEADIDECPEELDASYPRPKTRSQSSNQSNGNTTLIGSTASPTKKHHHGRKPSNTRQRSRSRARTRHHYSIDEEPTGTDQDPNTTPSPHSSLSEFEILHNAGGTLSRPPRARSSSRRPHPTTQQSRPTVIAYEFHLNSIRIKVHCGDDTRYMMLTPDIQFLDFVERVREKFSLSRDGGWKVKVRDEGDLITVGDRDDWEMAVGGVKREARGEGAEMGKMECWVVEGGGGGGGRVVSAGGVGG